MSTDKLSECQVQLTRPRRQRSLVNLPLDPSDEDLARDWTLSEADKTEIHQCRGDDNRLRFAI